MTLDRTTWITNSGYKTRLIQGLNAQLLIPLYICRRRMLDYVQSEIDLGQSRISHWTRPNLD